MSDVNQRADPIEAETFLYKNPDLEAVDLLVPDNNGVLRGKRVNAASLGKVYREGIYFPESIFATMANGETASGIELGIRRGDGDRPCWPIAGSLRMAPWQPRPLAQALLTMSESDERPHFADPRQVLDAVNRQLSTLALEVTVAFELEFYLLDRKPNAAGQPRPPRAPDAARREQQAQVFGIRELDSFDPLLDEIGKCAERQELPIETIVSEYAPGQFEINLHYQTDPLLACDHAITLKRLVVGVARKHGYEATFMAKPYDELAGNGLHLHLGLRDREQRNVFVGLADHDDPSANPRLRQTVAGLLATMVEAAAIFFPNANSYRRLAKESLAPDTLSWGIDNRTVAVRVPSGPLTARRIEHRVAGADANPYLLMSAALAGAHHGLSLALDVAAPITGNAYQQRALVALPRHWSEAINAFEQAAVLPEYLGARFCRLFAQTQRSEMALFDQRVTALEHDWYL